MSGVNTLAGSHSRGSVGMLALNKQRGDLLCYTYGSPHKDRNTGACVWISKVLVAMQVTLSVPMTTRLTGIRLLSTYLVISEEKTNIWQESI